MPKFDTQVQYLKYRVLKEVAKHAFEDNLTDCQYDIPKKIVKGNEATMRCCVYKERAIVGERIKMAMGGNKSNPNIIEVLDIACDECPVTSYTVTDACRGCIAHRCEQNCRFGAISFDRHKAYIDPAKCKECGKCASACPYGAIQISKRPCERACKIKAISMDENKKAKITDEKCIQCGACVYQCPFGAIMDKSFICDAIDILKESDFSEKHRVYAVVAPSISAQFIDFKLGRIITAIKKLGFFSVVEAALGADMVAFDEAKELSEKGFLTSSCCPAFVRYVELNFPLLKDDISHNPSPMQVISKFIKKSDPGCKIVFIGPCTAKKAEFRLEKFKGIVDCVLTFEELQALFDSRDINIESLEESFLDNASYFGRIFARSGGLSKAVEQALSEQGVTPDKFELKAVACDGIEECRTALFKASKSKALLGGNFIEGMACVGGCIGGAANLTHEPKDKNEVDKYGMLAKEKTISDALRINTI
ncbi:MAG: 4Fe-4S dicluster domain-containing protein [Oscillospiraceae bacterium]